MLGPTLDWIWDKDQWQLFLHEIAFKSKENILKYCYESTKYIQTLTSRYSGKLRYPKFLQQPTKTGGNQITCYGTNGNWLFITEVSDVLATLSIERKLHDQWISKYDEND